MTTGRLQDMCPALNDKGICELDNGICIVLAHDAQCEQYMEFLAEVENDM